MSGYLPVNLDEWKLATEIDNNETRHPSSNSLPEIWKRDKDQLGRGGFGEVWKETTSSILNENRPQVRAVKRIRKTEKSTPELPNLIRLSTKEYYGIDHLQHFVEFFGWFEDQHNIYISMEYIPNRDLQHHIQDRHESGEGFQEPEGKLIVTEIAKALKFMHEKKVMHRDLKPANVLIHKPAPEWKVKLADFGISKDIELASAQTKAGTDGYMAPEVADPKREMPYTMAADIWSLGAVTFCIQTGKPPFQDILAVGRYIDGKGVFPFHALLGSSGSLVIFIMQLMDIVSTRRPSVNEVLHHEWLKPRSEEPAPNEEIYISEPRNWSAPPSGEWPDSEDDSVGESEESISSTDASRPSSPLDLNRILSDAQNLPLNRMTTQPSPRLEIHHVASDLVGAGTGGYGETPPLRPSSSPVGDAERDVPPALLVNSKSNTYVESFRYLQNVDRKESSIPPLNQPDLQPPKKAPEKSPWPLQHGDSGYSTSSVASSPPPQKNELIFSRIKPEKMPEESPQPYFGLDQFFEPAEKQNRAAVISVGAIKKNEATVKIDEHNVNFSLGMNLSQTEHNLIDLTDSNITKTPPDDTMNQPVYGPWPAHHNPWA